MKKIILLTILSSLFLVGCGAEKVEEKPNESTQIEKQEPTKEESINTVVETFTKGKITEPEKGFAVVTANLEDQHIEVKNATDIGSNIDLSVSQALEIYDKIQYIYKKDGKSVIILDYTKDSIKKGGNFIDKAQEKFIDPALK